MSRQSDHAVLAAARAELTAAYTLVADPQCHNNTAMPHLRRAWEAVSTVSKGYPPDAAGSTMRDWLGEDHLQAIPTKQQGTVHGTLMAVYGFSRDPKPWDEATNGARVPGDKALFANMRALSTLIEVMTVEQQGREAATTIGLRWAKRAAIWGGIGVAFLLVALRPWQRDDIGPWRAAYYPTEKFEGEPDLRREVDIDFDWGKDPPTDSIPSDRWGARFDTCLALDEETEIGFQVVSDDGSKIYVDGEVIINNWDKHGPKPKGKKVTLDKGMHHLRVDYFDTKHGAMLELVASFDPDQAPSPIPGKMLEFPGMDIDLEGNPCENIE